MARFTSLEAGHKEYIQSKLAHLVTSESQWPLLWPLLLKELNKSRNGEQEERLEHLVRLYTAEGIHALRAVREKLMIVVSCPCGFCDEQRKVSPKRVGGKIELPVGHLCRTQSYGTPGRSSNHVRIRDED